MSKVALVTGGTRGIGEAISKGLKAAGYTVAANYSGNDAAAAKFKEETGIAVYKFDVGDYDATAAAIKQIEADLAILKDRTAGVRTYQATTDMGTTVDFYPASNIDPSVTPNAPAASASATVNVPALALVKSASTSIVEAGNDGPVQATIGERIHYTLDATIPGGTTILSGVLDDAVPSGLGSVTLDAATLNSGALPGGWSATVTGNRVTVALPASYLNATGDDVVHLALTGTVLDVAGNVRGTTIRNAATFTGTGSNTASAHVDSTVVEPVIHLAKADDDADHKVSPGQHVRYTLTITNAGLADATSLTVTDTLPVSLHYVSANGGGCMDLPLGLPAGVPLWLQQFPCNGGANQRLKFESLGNGTYRIHSAYNETLCLDIPSGNTVAARSPAARAFTGTVRHRSSYCFHACSSRSRSRRASSWADRGRGWR